MKEVRKMCDIRYFKNAYNDYSVEKHRVIRSHEQIGNFLIKNGLSYELREELQDGQILEKLIELLPNSKKDCDAFELNCFYQIYQKRLQNREV